MTDRRSTPEKLASILGIKPKIMEADIRDLAWLWERTIADMGDHNPLAALDILHAIATAYLRGRDCRMGSYQTLWKHLPTKAAMIYHLARYVSEKNAPESEYAWFPHLRDCGVMSVDEYLELAARTNAERTLKQEEGERQTREQAKERGRQKEREVIDKMRRQGEYSILDEIRRIADEETGRR